MKALLLLPLLGVGCLSVDAPRCYPSYIPANYTSYEVSPDSVTPGGVQLDDPDHQLDPVQIDATVKSVVECLQVLESEPMTKEERAASNCFAPSVLEARSCLTIKVAPDWHVSSCTNSFSNTKEQVFACSVGDASCQEKGLTPTDECPCSCRAVIQDDTTIIVTPNLKLLPGNLVYLLVGCDHIWNIPRISKCADPSQVALRH